MDKIPAVIEEYKSIDRARDENQAVYYTTEFLNSVESSGTPSQTFSEVSKVKHVRSLASMRREMISSFSSNQYWFDEKDEIPQWQQPCHHEGWSNDPQWRSALGVHQVSINGFPEVLGGLIRKEYVLRKMCFKILRRQELICLILIL
ncbi:Hypothetical predicted protein [Octopus vulgaris]|uniref:Uncharacterized protein n=1 Tax=Octopus vulgaris TaxID=6645 RepID=A0AA36BD45_OCTVU|nr:Hypothetical predicted protein [Octopus vulgaris]